MSFGWCRKLVFVVVTSAVVRKVAKKQLRKLKSDGIDCRVCSFNRVRTTNTLKRDAFLAAVRPVQFLLILCRTVPGVSFFCRTIPGILTVVQFVFGVKRRRRLREGSAVHAWPRPTWSEAASFTRVPSLLGGLLSTSITCITYITYRLEPLCPEKKNGAYISAQNGTRREIFKPRLRGHSRVIPGFQALPSAYVRRVRPLEHTYRLSSVGLKAVGTSLS